MELINKEKLEDIMVNPLQKEVKLIVSGPKGFLGPRFAENTAFLQDRVANILNGFIIANPISWNKNEDKMSIYTMHHNGFSPEVRNRMLFEDYSPSESYHASEWYKRWMLRVSIIAGFAYCGMMEGSVYQGYIKNQQASNLKFSVKHKDIYPLLRERMEFTGDGNKDFENAFKILWLHFPQELTGRDSEMLRITLQEGLLEASFK